MATAGKIAELGLKVAINYNKSLTEEEISLRNGIWYQSFSKISDDILEAAVDVVIKQNMFYPNAAEIMKVVEQVRSEMRQAERQLVQRPCAELPTATVLPEIVENLNELIQSGKQKDYLGKRDISRLMAVARVHFPGIEEETVRANLIEFSELAQQEDGCWNCRTSNYCPGGGAKLIPVMHPNGYVKLEATICRKAKDHRIA